MKNWALILTVFNAIILCMNASAQLQLHPENPHYFLFRGKPAVLITSGEHYGSVMNLGFDYEKYLQTLQKEGFNYTRIFTGPYSEIGSDQFGITNNTMNPAKGNWITPWVFDASAGRYDLDQWNPSYFDRLKKVVQSASDKGIVCEITLFTSWYVQKHWENSPFYFRNNKQNLDSLHYSRANTLYNGKLLDFQEQYVRKTVKELNGFDNVIFEIQNEPWSDNPNLAAFKNESDNRVFTSDWQKRVELANNVSIEWQEKVARFITDEESNLSNRHLVSQNICNFGTVIPYPDHAVSVFNFHYALPDAASSNMDIPAAMALDETGFMPHDNFTYRRQAWKFMLGGGALYNNLDYSFIAGKEDGTQSIDDRTPGWGGVEMRRQFRILKDFMDKLDFVHMKPEPRRISGLAEELQVFTDGREKYVVYLDDNSIVHLELSLPTGDYTVEHLNPANGSVKAGGVHNKYGTVELFLSFDEDEVLTFTKISDQVSDKNFSETDDVLWIESAGSAFWNQKMVQAGKHAGQADVMITGKEKQVVDGFGVCFNELGWTALSVLNSTGKEKILMDLFDPEDGLKLNICRMPIGANDYARDYYSLNDSAGDFAMKYFSIERDKTVLIPYIKAAMKYRPDLKVWGSPWTPPSWMKTNNHYACHPDVVNDMKPEQAGQEGRTQFRMEKKYLDAYALYFVKYIQAYRNEGINIIGVNVQNEMNSCQNFPSCIWTATDLGTFIGRYLGPQMKKTVPDADIWYGTYERPLVEKIDTIMQNPVTSKYIAGVSFQWAGKQAIPGVHAKYPDLKLMQSETECGNGSNDWPAAEYTFSLMKHYFENGVSVYTFWNSILDETGKSMWGWKQNSMISVDSKTREVKYNPEFYLLKHFSYLVQPGARMLQTEGKNQEVLAFRNPDGKVIIVAGNKEDRARELSFTVSDHTFTATLKPHSFNSFVVR